MTIRRLLWPALLLLSLSAASASAQSLFALRSTAQELYRVDTLTGQTSLIGPYKVAAHEFGVFSFATAADGSLIGIASSNQPVGIYSFDKQTGKATFLQKFPNPVTPAGAAIDPTDGTFWFLNTFGFVNWPTLNRVDLTTGAITVPGLIGPNGSDQYSGIAFDASGQLYALNGTTNSLWRVDKSDPGGANTVQVGSGIGGGIDLQGASLAFDPGTQLMFATEPVNDRLLSIDTATGLGGVLHSSVAPEFAAITSEVGGCTGKITPFGAGCAGTGGFVPDLTVTGCPQPGDQIGLSISQGLGGSSALLLFGLAQANTPIGGGCTLNVAPVLPAVLTLPLGGAGPENGSVSISGIIPANASGVTITLQAFVLDSVNPIGAAGTRGVEMIIP